MRLHRLWLRAFGPFAGEEEVDFDTLAGGGLFLLHGPTGSGKTSVLDAVCFALYGTVPGARAAGGRLRSDHAPDGVGPQVRCEFSVGPRRFEVTRSPAWERPKKRGEGTTTEQARVLVRERVGGQWQPRTQRIDEAADLLCSVLCLTADQFTKLVMLPQGEFAAFLRADAETRRQMLERLFDTDRFQAVQDWLRDHHSGLRHRVDAAEAATGQLLARAAQAASGVASSGAAADGEPDTGPDVTTAVAELRAGVGRAWEEALGRRAATQARLHQARRDREQGRALAELRREAEELVRRRAQLEEAAADREDRRRRLREAERAAALGPLVPALSAAGDRVAVAQQAVRAAERDVPSRLAAAPEEDLAAAAVAARHEMGHLSALDGEEAELTAVRARVAALSLASGEAAARRERADAERLRLETDVDGLRRALAGATARGGARDALAAAERAAAETAQAAAERDRLDGEVRLLRAARDDAREARDTARQHWLDLREQRLQGIAVELAGRLTDGEACPVCGSPSHPAPAAGDRPAVTEADEQAARAVLERADGVLAGAEQALHEEQVRLGAARRAAGGLARAVAEQQHATAVADREEADRAAREAAEIAQRVEALQRDLDLAGRQARTAAEEVHGLQAGLAREGALERDLVARVDAARGDDPSVAARRRRLEAQVEALEALLEARRDLTSATTLHAQAEAGAQSVAREAGFATVAGALAAVLPEAEREALREGLADQDAEASTVAARLAAEAIVAAGQAPPPDLLALTTAEELAEADDAEAARRVTVCETAVEALDGIAAALREHLGCSAPLLERYQVVRELFRCAEGTGGDNTRRMSLSAYVLAARLEQVAAAAGVRLREMSGGRYELVHSDALERGRARSGLGLQVVDSWTGQHRDTATLSGGEAFYTSLALALGLADVVSAEAGGTAIETLFVDEGFGSLDEQTLEDVMGVLDGLRCGGRAVGLVSHVPELRVRIPSRLEVLRRRDGSQLRQIGA